MKSEKTTPAVSAFDEIRRNAAGMDCCCRKMTVWTDTKYKLKTKVGVFVKRMFTGLFLFCLFSISMYAETVQLDKDNSITIDIPANWEITQLRGSQMPEIVNTFNLKLTSPSNEKAVLTVTIGKSQTDKPLTKKQFDSLTKIVTTTYLQRTVEKKAVFNSLPIRGGQGKYSIFTNAAAVNKTRGPDDYLYVFLFLINYDDGCFVYATGVSDDRSGAGFQNIMKSVSSIEPSFAAIIQTPPVQIKINKKETNQ